MISELDLPDTFRFTCEICNFECKNKNDYRRHLNTKKHQRGFIRVTPVYFTCENCNFVCTNKNDYTRHLNTVKHNRLHITSDIIKHVCVCGKEYKNKSSLYRHRNKCCIYLTSEPVQMQQQPTNVIQFENYSRLNFQRYNNSQISDDQIDKIVTELEEERKMREKMEEQLLDQKTMFYTMLDKYFKESQQATQNIVNGNRENTQELINKFIEMAPKMGSRITNNDNRQIVTFNYYLENDCKNAETIHDFIHRYAIKCGDFFRNNATAIVNGEVSLSFNAHKLFFESLRENPQHMNFVQTSNVHDGIHYVKEREHGEGDDYLTLYGEAEFNKYTDKFRSKGAEISVAVCQVLNRVREEIYNQRKRYCRPEPTESDYSGEYASYATQFTEDMEEYHRQYENSVEYNSDLNHVLTRQVFSVLNLFDMDRTEGKTTCKEILQASRRVK